MIKIIAIGKKHETWVLDGIERYQKRLRAPWDIEWVLLPHSSYERDRARQEESERILNRLNDSDYVVLLDESGRQFDSPGLAQKLDGCFVDGKSVVVVIGGAYGVSASLQQRADLTWSLSKLVFPHQLVRLVLVEQIYRAQQIIQSTPYHHS